MKVYFLSKMKILLLCALFAYTKAASLPEDAKDIIKASAEKCIKELDLNKEKLEAAHTRMVSEDDEEMLRFFGCLGDERKYFLESGALNADLIRDQVETLIPQLSYIGTETKAVAKKMVDTCLSSPSTDKPKNVIRMHNCAVDFLRKLRTEHLRGELERSIDECIDKLNLDKDKYRNKYFSNEKFEEDDKEAGEFYGCLGDKRKYFLESGELDLALIGSQLDDLITAKFGGSVDAEEIVRHIKEHCLATTKADKPQNSIRAHNCAIEQLDEHRAKHIMEKSKRINFKCIEKLNLDKEKYETMLFTIKTYPEDDEEFQKWYGCIGDERHMFLDNGEVDVPHVYKHLKEYMKMKLDKKLDLSKCVDEVKSKCLVELGNNKPINAIKAHNCIIAYMEKHTSSSD